MKLLFNNSKIDVFINVMNEMYDFYIDKSSPKKISFAKSTLRMTIQELS